MVSIYMLLLVGNDNWGWLSQFKSTIGEKKIKIPNEYQQFGQTIKIVFKEHLISKEDAEGLCCHKNNTITLQNLDVLNRPISQLEHTFIHEVLHHALELLGYSKESKDEEFVDRLAGLLHQAVITAVYK